MAEDINNMSYKKSEILLIVSALAIGGLTYFYLNHRSNLASKAIDKAVEVIAKETNQRPKTEADLQKKNIEDRTIASVDQSEYQQQQSHLSAFARSGFADPSLLHSQVDKISKEILKSNLAMEKKSELNAELHEIASKKIAQLRLPKVVDTKLDLKDNIVYPVFETK